MKKKFKYAIPLFVLAFLGLEITHQFYIKSKYFINGHYLWEEYAIKRNHENINKIENFFSTYKMSSFNYEINPNSGSLFSLPKDVQNAIIDIRDDMLKGICILSNKGHFSLSFSKTNNLYILRIYAGANFIDDYNGYNLSLVITNGKNPSNDYVKYYQFKSSRIFYDMDMNRKYRSNFIFFKYNYVSPDFLILKLFR